MDDLADLDSLAERLMNIPQRPLIPAHSFQPLKITSGREPLHLAELPAEGLTNNVQLDTSHAGYYYEYAVRPLNWINYSDPADEF